MTENYYLDTMRQLRSGLGCYVFKEEYAKIIKRDFEKETGIKVKIVHEEHGYIKLVPEKKFYKSGRHY